MFIYMYVYAVFNPLGSRGSLAVLNCAAYPYVCERYTITHYPTVLLFKASPNDWVPYKGMMDSRELLRALDNTSVKKEGLVS